MKIDQGTIGQWTRCNDSLSYEYDVESVVEHHRLLSEKGFQALVYRYIYLYVQYGKLDMFDNINVGSWSIGQSDISFYGSFTNGCLLSVVIMSHDMVIPYMTTLKWIRKLNITLYEEWRAWVVDGQVAG